MLGGEPADLHVPDLRPRPAGRLGVRQPGPAPRAPGRRIRALTLLRVRVPGQASTPMAGLPAPVAVLAPLPLRFLPLPAPGLAPLLRPDRLLRRRRPGVRAVLAQPAFQLRDPQLQPPVPVPAQRPAPPAASRSQRPSPPPQPAAGPAAHAAPRHRQTDQAHRAQAPIMLNPTTGSSTARGASRRPRPVPDTGAWQPGS